MNFDKMGILLHNGLVAFIYNLQMSENDHKWHLSYHRVTKRPKFHWGLQCYISVASGKLKLHKYRIIALITHSTISHGLGR